MKPKFIFTLLILLLPVMLQAQDFWKKVNFPTGSGTIFTVIYIGGTKYLAGSSTAVFSSNDNGENWSKLSEIEQTTITDVLIKTKTGVVIAGTSRGIYRSTDLGITWSQANNGIDNPDIFSLLETPAGKIYAGSGKGYLYASTDDGINWTKVLTAGVYTYFESIVINSKGMILTGTYNAYGSQGVFRSTDDGISWTSSSTGLVGANAYSLIVGRGDVIFAGSSKGVHKSTDDGITWQQLTNGMPSAYSTNCMAISNNGNLYIGTVLNGIYYSTNEGASWNDLNSGLSYKLMQTIIVANDGHLIAGGMNGNLFKSNNIVTAIENISTRRPDNYHLFQNYPNPFNPSTIIKYSIPENSFVTIKVYNAIGQEINTLVNEVKSKGTYQIKWEPKSSSTVLPSGVYYYRISSANFIDVGKMMYLK